VDVPKLPPGLFSNQLPAPDNGPVNVLLLDYLNTPLTAHLRLRAQLIDFLKKAPPGTRIAIIGLSNGLTMLQGFTSDKQVLEGALTSKEGLPRVSNILEHPVIGGTDDDTTISDNLFQGQTQFNNDGVQAVFDAVKRFEEMRTADNQIQRVLDTLSAFNQLARYLVAIPGRKNVIWFSAGFPLDIQPDLDSVNHPNMGASFDEDLRKTDNLLTQAQIAVYPIDVEGVVTDPSMDMTNPSPTLAQLCPPISQQLAVLNGGGGSGTCGAQAAQAQMAFLKQQAQQHLTMEAMAEETGGKAFYNTNDLTSAIRTATASGSNYYTLSYSPGNQVWDERFRSIKLKVDEPGVVLSYRQGYYAVDPENAHRTVAQGSAMVLQPPTTMATAMLHGGPEGSQILFKARIRPSSDVPSTTVLAADQSSPDVKVKGPFKAYGVDLVPDLKAVNCDLESDGNRHCALEFWTFVYNAEGEKLISASDRFQTKLTPTAYAKLLSGGMAFHQEISVPVKGRYFLRTAIHDLNSDRVGTLEIPVSAVANLAPLKIPGAASPEGSMVPK
jgi:VWFA-related protein